MAKRMGLAASAEFCRRFGTAFRAGVDILSLCRSESKHGSGYHQTAMRGVADRIAKGETLADSMQQVDSRYFPRLMISMVRLGEQTGRLERTLLQMAEHYRHRLSNRRVFLTGIAWPMIQLFAAIFVIGLLIWIMGILRPATGGEMNDILGLGLRGNSGLLIYAVVVLTIAAMIALFVQALRFNWLNLHAAIPIFYLIPKIGPSIQTITLARFCWTLAMGLDAGLDPMRSVELAMDSTGSDHYRAETRKAQDAIQRGDSLVEALAITQVFPNEFLNQLEVAEIAGTDAESLAHLAQIYDEKAKIAMRTITGALTAAIWLSVAGILIFFIFRIVLSISQAYSEALSPI